MRAVALGAPFAGARMTGYEIHNGRTTVNGEPFCRLADGTPEGDGRGEAFLTVTIAFEDGGELTAAFYRYDSANCLCEVNGGLRLVSRTGAEALAESAGALLRAR